MGLLRRYYSWKLDRAIKSAANILEFKCGLYCTNAEVSTKSGRARLHCDFVSAFGMLFGDNDYSHTHPQLHSRRDLLGKTCPVSESLIEDGAVGFAISLREENVNLTVHYDAAHSIVNDIYAGLEGETLKEILESEAEDVAKFFAFGNATGGMTFSELATFYNVKIERLAKKAGRIE